jgi:type IV pilus assembly protein PilA
MKKSVQSAFTLIELLVVIAIISVLATVVFVALDPAGRLADARNARRINDVQNILTAVHECIVDNAGATATCLESGGGALTAGNVYEVTNAGTTTACNNPCTGASSATSCATISDNLASYLASLPIDPGGVTAGHTGYSVSLANTGIVTINSCSAEGTTISASR